MYTFKVANRELTVTKSQLITGGILLACVLLGFWLRMIPYNATYLADIDTHYLIRQAHYVYTHGFHLYQFDPMRYYPTSIDIGVEYPGTYFIPPIIYWFLSKILFANLANLETFIAWAKVTPALLGALFALPAYFIGRELKDSNTGLAAAFLTAVSTATYYRTSAGVYEKESLAGLFLLISTYALISAYKRNSLLSGLLAGASLYLARMVWGGSLHLFFSVILVFALSVLLVQNNRGRLYRSLGPVVLFDILFNVLAGRHVGTFDLAGIGVGVLLVAEAYVLKQAHIKEHMKKNFIAGTYAAGAFVLLAGSFFSRRLADIVSEIKALAYSSQGVIGSTVAENAPGSWGAFTNQLGTDYASGFLTNTIGQYAGQGAIGGFVGTLFNLVIKTIMFFSNTWTLAGIAVGIFIWVWHGNKPLTYVGFAAILLNLMAFKSALGTHSFASQTLFLLTTGILIALATKKDFGAGLLVALVYTSMLGFIGSIRILFLTGLYVPILAGYAAGWFFELAKPYAFREKSTKDDINYHAIILGVLAVAFVFGNAFPPYIFGHQTGPAFNQNWDEAMTFVREKTPTESVLLSWWDYGYWFQLQGNRTSNLDGGNNFAARNIPTAQYFTGMMNESQQTFYLQKFGTTHIIVDASMIGKYGAMSKIANQGQKVEFYSIIGFKEVRQSKAGPVLVYEGDGVSLLVPLTANGTLTGAPRLITPQGEGVIPKLCVQGGEVDLPVPNGTAVSDSCVMLSQQQAVLIPTSIARSVFHDLFFNDGKNTPYVKKVFANGEVQIYEIDPSIIPRESLEDLRTWWNTHSHEDLMVNKFVRQ